MNRSMPVMTRRSALSRAALLLGAAWGGRLLHGASEAEPLGERDGSNVQVQQRRRQMAAAAVERVDLGGGYHQLRLAGTGNLTVHVAREGVLLVDAGPRHAAAVARSLAALSERGVQWVINTHWHLDHTDGNGHWRREGAEVIAHEHVRRRLAVPGEVAFFGFELAATPPGALPNVTLASNLTLHHGGDEVHLQHLPGHTDGDVVVEFPGANLLATGDLYFAGSFPFIDRNAGGSLTAMIAATRCLLDRCDAATRVVPGHGAVSDRNGLRATHDMLRLVQDRIARLQDRGLTVDEAVAAEPLADLDDTWGHGFVTTPNFIRLIYPFGD